MLTVLRQRNFALFWLADLISTTGDWLLFIALPYYVYQITGSALATGLSFILYNVPRLLLGSLAGVLVDRWDRQRILVLTNAASALFIWPLFLVRSSGDVWIIYLVVFSQACISHILAPAETALLPLVVSDEHLVAANALDGMTNGVARLIGPTLGGIVLGWLGFGAVVAADIASFVVAAALVASIVVRRAKGDAAVERRSTSKLSWSAVRRDWLDGLAYLRQSSLVVVLFWSNGMVMVAYGVVTVLLVVFVRDVLDGSALEYGWIATSQGIGILVGTAATGSLGRALTLPRLYAISLGAMGLAYLVAFNVRALPIALLAFGLAGLGLATSMVCQKTLMQQLVSNQFLGRLTGMSATVGGVLILLGMALAATIPGRIGVVGVLDGAALVYGAAGIFAFLKIRRIRDLSRMQVVGDGCC